MKILIFGASGMIGHKMYQVLSQSFSETYACFRQPFSRYEKLGIFNGEKVIDGIDAANFANVEKALNELRPDVILNCIGITLRKPQIKDLEYCMEINSLFPHRLKAWAQQNKANLIHFSTDCVFDGSKSIYDETSEVSAKDVYGRSKYLGEVNGEGALTLRGSMIGREIEGKTELLEWCLAQKGKVIKGYSKAIYSGVTTQVMADLVVSILSKTPLLTGLYQVSAEPISKYELLTKLNSAFELKMTINEDSAYASSKVLNSSKIRRETGFVCPSWDKMIAQIANDKTHYF